MTLSKYNLYKDKTYTLTQKPTSINNNKEINLNNNNIDNDRMVTKWNDNNDAEIGRASCRERVLMPV